MALCLLLAATLWRDHRRRLAGRLGAWFAIGVAASTWTSMPGYAPSAQLGHAIAAGLAAGSMCSFWLFTRALFDDAFRLRGWHIGLWLAMAAIGIVDCALLVPRHSPLAEPAGLWLGAAPVAWAALAVAQSIASWREDLVEGRRHLRTAIVAATGAYTFAQLVAALAYGLSLRAVSDSTWAAAGTALLALFVAWELLRAGGASLFGDSTILPAATVPASDEPILEVPAASIAGGPPDPAQVAALEALMTVDHIHREPRLTIAALADRMALPEHKLRRLINQGLGHRNFSAFLNGYRLADAKRWLADPAQSDTPIVTIAMDAGFQSLGPFNRAFKADTGVTPTEYRRARSGAANPSPAAETLAESGIG
ncbi:MAG: helix-turn-helix transcriptional regulator [Proteobacteria bacterium]|nr:helix-turn-helix transcriptional regulator [Pseudomonadota bacterium]